MTQASPVLSDMRTVNLRDGSQVRFWQAGQGPDLLLIHGTLVTLEDMVIALADVLTPHYRVTAVDRPGHGASTRPRFVASARAQAKALHEVAAVCGLHNPVVVGHSAGGPVAMAYALDFPGDVAGVVSLAPLVLPEFRLEHILFGPRAVPGGGLLAGTVGSALDAVLNPVLWQTMFLPQIMPERFAAEFAFALANKPRDMQATGEEAIAASVELAANLPRYLACSVPTVVLIGGRDIVINPGHGRVLATLLPKGRHRILPGLGHMIHHFAQAEIAEAIASLVQGRSRD